VSAGPAPGRPAGRLYGIGTGPGDPELLTLKAARLLGALPVIGYFAKEGRSGNGLATVCDALRPDAELLPLPYPVTTELHRHDAGYRDAITGFFDAAAEAVAQRLSAGLDVGVLSEGDPMFYGSWMHLHRRLATRFHIEVVAGVTSLSGAWSQAGLPIAQGDDVLVVLPGTLKEEVLARRIAEAEAAVIMKVGRNLPRIRRALEAAGKLDRAVYVERATMPGGRVISLVEHDGSPAPYFSVVLVPGWA
jgi:precorrin-2/cobalt-factor-2 C20-methyltransferase